jgi:hypothetical protein
MELYDSSVKLRLYELAEKKGERERERKKVIYCWKGLYFDPRLALC